MSRVSVYESSDHRLHRDRTIYRKHQAWLDLVRWCDETLPNMVPEEVHGEISARTMCEHRETLRTLLRLAEEAS